MSLKRRNVIAWVLMILASLSWVYGKIVMENGTIAVQETTFPVAGQMTSFATVFPTSPSYNDYDQHMVDDSEEPENAKPGFIIGFLLRFAGIASAVAAVLVLWQQSPALGPDGLAILPVLLQMLYVNLYRQSALGDTALRILLTFVILVSARELWGWGRSRFPLSWCLVHRLSSRCPRPQLSLMVYVGWITGGLICIAFDFFRCIRYSPYFAPIIAAVLSEILGICCLWKYGSDLHHFENQLNNFQNGLPITVKDGAFAQTEAQLLAVQAQHEEAVRTAVTSERFKVELISNVSHDLRTPLTSILGYGELLQKESLSPAGQAQLTRLNQKAGYMRDLVDSLFELTKVSSGVLEAKEESIDLIRLLEQTIGLFDDQLTEAGLYVRRHYPADAIPIITDGARMHQVFANLLGNAIKYALPGTRIYLEVKETETSCAIRMMNTASYEMDFQPEEILQRFARGDKARTTQGSGLGLAIAQTYTESVGGHFRVAVDGDQFSAIVELPKTERNL